MLAFVPESVNNRLRFAKPTYELVLDRWRSSAHFLPDAIFCRVCWLANDYGTTVWNLSVLQAGRPSQPLQRMAGVLPGAKRLLHVSGELKVQRVLHIIDRIEVLGIAPTEVSPAYWQLLHGRLAAREPLPEYTLERHSAHLAGEVFR
ncbi:DUF2840 domain-containing protein [Caenimonas soli]|uniref:DUF2840 domain-containing protein n=1 Tax=Caenimonas soli TaxID=2735555 RepID=UPI001F1E2192|nr:DUF2840 domain-containing protein [Caenimonas soli]